MNPTADRRHLLSASASVLALAADQHGGVTTPADRSREALAEAASRLRSWPVGGRRHPRPGWWSSYASSNGAPVS